jgi:hypothetical protein
VSLLNLVVHQPSGNFTLSKDEKNKVEKKSLTNARARKCAQGLKTLSNTAFGPALDEDDRPSTRERNERHRQEWNAIADAYCDVVEKMRQEEDFSDNDIEAFQDAADLFFERWLDHNGNESITHYIHIIGAGHLRYYLIRYRNLYRFSQQGWEALNQKIKRYWHNNTNKGGNVGGKQHLKQDEILPIMKWCCRYIMWHTGKGDQFFINKELIE